MMNFCTLFDANYLDKGIALYNSIVRHCEVFTLYILPMDSKCRDILLDLNFPNVVLVNFEDFMDEHLWEAKNNRSAGEFCWTCTPFLIDYCLKKYNLKIVTYIDSDLFFYSNPQVVIDEMVNSGSSVQIIKHNFMKSEYEDYSKIAGEYCVQFNTFLNNGIADEVLADWKNDCIRDCSYGVNEDVLGDQKYLNKWPSKYSGINISENLGAGVAPWNVKRYAFFTTPDKSYSLKDYDTGEVAPIVFFHFQNLIQVKNKVFFCCIARKSQRKIVKQIYVEYISELQSIKDMLNEKYQVNAVFKKHPVVEQKKIKENMIKKMKSFVIAWVADLRNYKNGYEKIVVRV